jgi:hypothetical protein
MSLHWFVESTNVKQFFLGVIICSLAGFLVFSMLESTSWTTYYHTENTVTEGEFGPVTFDSKTEMEFGLNEAIFIFNLEECDEDDRCYTLEVDEKDKILDITLAIVEDSQPIDCENTEDLEQIKTCEVESAGSTSYWIICGGLILLALSLFLACISVIGYIPGWIIKLLSSISGVIIFIGPIVWFVMSPDLNNGLEPNEQKWVLSHAFYLTLLSGPIVFFGGSVFGSMEAFALEEDDDWDIDDYGGASEEFSTYSTPVLRQESFRPERSEQVDVNWQGVWGDDGYEWIEHPEGSEIWYWRDQDTGQWVRH